MQSSSRVVTTTLLSWLYRPVVRSATRAALEGRLRDPAQPERGRFGRTNVDSLLRDIRRRSLEILREEDLRQIPALGNRHNVFLAALTLAAYHALLDDGVERDHAIELVSDVGWRIYVRLLAWPLRFARLSSRDPQRRMTWTLKMLMRFPFSAPGRPGYEVRVWTDSEGLHTDWTYCAPLGFIQRYIGRRGDRGELEMFRRSWCSYDWAAADLLAGGGHAQGHYRRLHTLSRGDSVCDMVWSASGRSDSSG